MRKFAMAIIMAAVFLFALAGCEQARNPQEVPVNAEPHALSDEIIKQLYQRAWTLYSWFALTTIPYFDFEDTAPSDNWWGSRVTHETFTTMAALQSALEGIFAPDIVEGLLALDRFREYDGILYTAVADRGTDISAGDEVHKIIRIGASEIIYRVSVDILEFDEEGGFWIEGTVYDVKVHDFHIVYTDGKWLFNNFHLVR